MLAAGGRYEGPADWGVPLLDPTRERQMRDAYRAQLRAEGVTVH